MNFPTYHTLQIYTIFSKQKNEILRQLEETERGGEELGQLGRGFQREAEGGHAVAGGAEERCGRDGAGSECVVHGRGNSERRIADQRDESRGSAPAGTITTAAAPA